MLTDSALATPPQEVATRARSWRDSISPLIWMVAILIIGVIPLKILSYGYLPIDDALRHSAKPVSGKSWADIVVLADWVKMDHNPGWHALLGAVQQATGCGTEALAMLSVAALFGLVCLAPLIWTRRPELWLSVLLMVSVALPALFKRFTYGRPLLLSVAVLMTLLLMWSRPASMTLWKRVVVSVFLFAVAAWVHGSWYLFAMPALAFALTPQWRSAAWLGGSWLGGSLLGGIFTGHPIVFLNQAIEVMMHAFGSGIPAERLAIEFQSSGGDLSACLIVALVLIGRLWSGASLRAVVHNAPFILMVTGFLLGLKVMRFWLDWGMPALLCWLLLQLEEPLARFDESSPRRLLFATSLAVALFFSTTNDRDQRWTASLYRDYLTPEEPGAAEWLPQPGGIVYNVQMQVFYRLFFKNPRADWRYALGFEPALMPAENFATYARILRDPHAPESYTPWVRKMRAADRVIIVRPEALAIPELEWRRFGRETWIGRLPAAPANSPARPLANTDAAQ